MQRILIAIDESEHAEKVIDKGLVLAEALKEMFLGSVSNKVVHLGCTSVMIVR